MFGRKPSLVTWKKGTAELVPGSEWMAPTGGAYDKLLHEASRDDDCRYTDDMVRTMGGSAVRLVVTAFPEGYHAVIIVDARTGKPAQGHHVEQRAMMHDGRPVILNALDGHPVDVGGGLAATQLKFTGNKLGTLVRPMPIAINEALIYGNLKNRPQTWVNPGDHTLEVTVPGAFWNGPLAGQGLTTAARISQNNGEVSGRLSIERDPQPDGTSGGRLWVDLNEHGQPTRVRAARLAGVLGSLDSRTMPNNQLVAYNADKLVPVLPDDRMPILDALAPAVWTDATHWEDIDMSASAQALYAHMPDPTTDPLAQLVRS